MITKIKFTALIVFCFSGLLLQGQDLLRKADLQYELGAYDLAIENYKEALKSSPKNPEIGLKLAQAYQYTNQYLDAIRWYERSFENAGNVEGPDMLNYAHCLKNVGLYDKAQTWYWKYKIIDPIVGEHFALSCDFAKSRLQESDYYNISLCKFNSSASDFGISFYKDQMVYTSFDQQNSLSDTGSKLYIESANGGKPTLLGEPLNSKQGIGPISYSKDGKMVVFMNNDFVNGVKQIHPSSKNTKLYLSFTQSNGDFQKNTAFKYNSEAYSNAYPFLAHNDADLYFSSTMPGGYGGFDLYVSHFKNGEWSSPENLGPAVNSEGNEITPFFDGETLYFASDYIQGLGGFDIFASTKLYGEWTFAENMGKGINSPNDDYYFAKNLHTGEMFFSSNRLGGRGKDDIYIAEEIKVYEYTYTDQTNEDNVFVPKAVSLKDLEISVQEPLQGDEILVMNLSGNEQDAKMVAVSEKTSKKLIETNSEDFIALNDNTKLSLEGAKRIALGEIMNTNSRVYFIQLAALSKSPGNVDIYRKLVAYGNIYKIQKSSAVKIKLGYFLDRQEATDVLDQVKRSGFKDAFITYDIMDSSELELIASSFEEKDYKTDSFEYTSQSQYKVRLASYVDPLWFDTSRVKDIGKLEQWTKGTWTIFVLGGFQNIEQAQGARIKAINRGFRDAEIVIDNNGILEKMVQN